MHHPHLDDGVLPPPDGPGLIDPTLGQWVAPAFEIHNALGLNWEIPDPFYYRKVLIKMYWDDQETPSVVVPLG